MSYESLMSHQNILTIESKMNGFNSLVRWIRNSFVDINEVITFNREALYCCFKFNILGQNDQQLLTKALTTFLEVYSFANEGSKFMLIQMIIEDVHYCSDI